MKRVRNNIFTYASRIIYPINVPGFIIIGGQKCGTTTLHYYLGKHPSLRSGRVKEVHYFNKKIYFGYSFDDYQKDFYGPPSKIYFETTPAYLYQPDVANNIHQHLPEIKMIAILRDPVKRSFSAWNHYKQLFVSGNYIKMIKNKPRREGSLLYEKFYKDRNIFPSFRECIEIELELTEKRKDCFEPALLRRGLYLDQLNEYWRLFPRDNIKIIGFKDLISDPVTALISITNFIGVEPISWENLIKVRKNYRPYSDRIIQEDKAFLNKYYEEPNQRLFEELGNINW